ncbi:hypothetical protein AK830_g265 [Neonectria ditissima]|uniref:Uncharacterized protein n=1 Tax=Neonectria ditissima TaxID=78410 RepID=A0A0P7C2Y6_9HYPO|nr:hypothetical protein AK830_g265 [Neonectria ditissima]
MGLTKDLNNRALWLSSFDEPLSIVDLPIPEANAGTVVIQVLAAPIVPYTNLVHSGKLPQLNLSLPLVPNPNAIGRVHAVGPDATKIKLGDLVYADATIRAREDPDVAIMSGHHGGEGPQGQRLMKGEWRDGSLSSSRRSLLQSIAHYSVAGGATMEAADVRVAETVIIGPSGGSFGGLAVEVALTLGANVIALRRNEVKLKEMKEKLNGHPRLSYVVMTCDDDADTEAILRATPNGSGAHVYNDWTPGTLDEAPFLYAAVRALKREGRVVLSGGTPGNIRIPYAFAVHKGLKIIGKWMCSRKTLELLVSMIEQGVLQIGEETGTETSVFGLEDHEKAIEHAAQAGGWRKYTVIAPNV